MLGVRRSGHNCCEVVAGAEQNIRTGQWYNQISDSHEDSVTSVPIVGGTSMRWTQWHVQPNMQILR